MTVRKKIEKKYLIALLICALIFAASLFGVFFEQQKQLNSQFDALISDNLAAYTHGQRRQANGIIIDIKNTLSGMAAMVEQAGLPPEGDWLNIYLNELSGQNELFRFDYIPVQQLEERLASEITSEESKNICRRLLAGEDIVTPVHQSDALDGHWVFAVAAPVKKNGAIIGAFRARMDAAMLFLELQESSLFEKSSSLLITQDGEIAYSDTNIYKTSGNLFKSMEMNGVKPETIAAFQQKVRDETSVTYHFVNNGKTYFAAADRLDYNNWYIVKFVRSGDVIATSEYISKSMVTTGILLVGLTALMISVAASLLLRQKKRLDLEARRYSLLSQFSDTLLFEYDYSEDTLRFTSNAQKVLMLEKLQFSNIAAPANRPDMVHPDDRPLFDNIFNGYSKNDKQGIGYSECRMKTVDGAYGLFGCHYKTLSGRDGAPQMVIGKLVDITGQRKKEKSLVEKTRKDPLTGLYNKAGEKVIEQLMEKEERGYLFMIDLDDFKSVNDTFGHAAGDRLLTKAAAELNKIFTNGSVTARVGGDEFVAYISGAHNAQAAVVTAKKVVDALSKLEIEHAPGLSVSASVGIAVYPDDGDNYPALSMAADEAMYEVKRGAKGTFAFYQGKTS